MAVSELTVDGILTQLEPIMIQMGPSESIVPQTENDDMSHICSSAIAIQTNLQFE